MTWATVPLAEVARVERNVLEPSAIPEGTRYLGLENIERGGSISGWQVIGDVVVASSKFSFTGSHLLYGKLRPNLGKIARPTFSGVCSTDILPIATGPRLDRSYLAHFLSQQRMVDHAASRATGANLPRLSPAELGKFEVPLPPLAEQRRIAAILDQADAMRAKRRQSLALLDDLGGALFHQMFNRREGVITRLGDATVIRSSLVDPKEACFRDWPHIAPDSIQSETGRLLPYRTVGEDRVISGKYIFEPGDVLYSKIRPGLNKVVIAPVRGLCSADMYALVADTPRMLPAFLLYELRSQSFLTYAESLSNRANIPKLNRDQLASYQFVLPAADVQAEFAARVTNIESHRRIVECAWESADKLFASLQGRFLGGSTSSSHSGHHR